MWISWSFFTRHNHKKAMISRLLDNKVLIKDMPHINFTICLYSSRSNGWLGSIMCHLPRHCMRLVNSFQYRYNQAQPYLYFRSAIKSKYLFEFHWSVCPLFFSQFRLQIYGFIVFQHSHYLNFCIQWKHLEFLSKCCFYMFQSSLSKGR